MRRSVWFVVAAGTVALAGCEGLKDAFSPQANVVATAAGRKLETDRLVALLTARVAGLGAVQDGPWRMAASPIVQWGLNNAFWQQQGLRSITERYLQLRNA